MAGLVSFPSGRSATVAHELPKLRVAGSNPVARSNLRGLGGSGARGPFVLHHTFIVATRQGGMVSQTIVDGCSECRVHALDAMRPFEPTANVAAFVR